MANSRYEAEIIDKTDNIIRVYENFGRENALKLWDELNLSLSDKRDSLSDEMLDLVLQLEFFMEGYPESDLSDLLHALYVAKTKQIR